MTRKFRAVNGIEYDAVDRFARRYYTRFGRPGQARYGKNQIIRRSRRDAKLDIRRQVESPENEDTV